MHWYLCLAALMLTTAMVAADNLVTNPSFEQAPEKNGEPPVGWTNRHAGIIEWHNDGGHDGQAYARLLDAAADLAVSLESTRVPARPGGVYTATAWFRTADTCQPGLYLNFYDEFGERAHHLYARAKGPTNGWAQVTVTTVAPEEAMEVSAMVYGYTDDVGDFDADGVSLTAEGGREPGTLSTQPATPGDKEPYEIGERLELFVDDFLLDDMTGGVERRLHHPVHREIVMELTEPWEGSACAYMALVVEEDRTRLYYRGSAPDLGEVTCVAESTDGINFTRPNLGLFETEGSRDNNIIWAGKAAHNFTPFRDPRSDIPEDERYKALAYGEGERGLFAYASADGYKWRLLADGPVITNGAFDSQNLAFWDETAGVYRDYHRKGRDGVRDIMTCTSEDFRTWTEPEFLDYGDAPREHLYTNGVLPYFRAPHIFIGIPARFVPGRKKVAEHKEDGISDAVLMSSRDGLHFQRWVEGFIRPGPEWQVWTDRNNYPAWGMLATSPEEISLYWTEHYRHPTMRFRRGTIRTDGFVSVHAGGAPGQMLTRPLIFTGGRLLVNYATSAVGSLRFALCDEAGETIEGFGLGESELLYGNEIEHEVTWRDEPDLSALAGQPVRLRVQIKDADLYSIRFGE
jgi:hypothetical protein